MTLQQSSNKKNVHLGFDAISIEGGLISPEWIAKVAQRQAELQSESDYKIDAGLNLRDEIGRYYRIAIGAWKERHLHQSSRIFALDLLKKCFGFEDIELSDVVVLDQDYYPITHQSSENLPVVMAKESEGLESLEERFGHDGRKRTAFGLVQEYLNSSDKVLWGICTDGNVIRVIRDNSSLTRPAWIEIDIKRIFEEELYADFAASWLLIHRSRFPSTQVKPEDCIIEKWRQTSLNEGKRAQDHLRIGVEEALEILGNGFIKHPGNNLLREAIKTNKLNLHNYYQELLRLIYRFIFLLTIEERNLLHATDTSDATKKIYREGYSFLRLREKAVRRNAYDRFGDLWKTTKIVFLSLYQGEKRLGLPALGGLFSTNQTLHLNECELDNKSFLAALYRLSWLKEEGGLVRVNWRDMGPEELGSVYESLLELVPQLIDDGSTFTFATGGEAKGNARKTSGSYYTPDILVQSLLDSALEPVIKNTIASNPKNPVEALLQITIVDPSCGSGHFLIAAARRLASHIARLNADLGSYAPGDFRHALRQVVGQCIFGVDINPMSAELCRVNLWLESFEPGRPLSFLDHHIRVGNSLMGTSPNLILKGIPDGAFEIIDGDEKSANAYLKKRNKNEMSGMGPLFEQLDNLSIKQIEKLAIENELLPDNELNDVLKRADFFRERESSSSFKQKKLLADAWTAAFVIEKYFKEPGRESTSFGLTQSHLNDIAVGRPIPDELLKKIEELSKSYGFFHWQLSFPSVFSKGGFDCVLGNPPWDKIQPEEEKFFAATRPDISNAKSAKKRKEMIENLEVEDKSSHARWKGYKRLIDGICNFISNSGYLKYSSLGNLNYYRLFTEISTLIINKSGRVGLVAQTGIATDESGKELFSHLFLNNQIVKFLDFENRGNFFTDVHAQFRFC